MSQTEKDLRKHSREKLRTWVGDTLELYHMAELSVKDCVAMMATEMSYATVTLLKETTSLTPEKFGELMMKTYEKAVADAGIEVELLHPRVSPDVFGILPEFLDMKDPRPAREQLHERYAHGGGWHPMKEWKLEKDNSIRYPGDPPHEPLAQIKFRNELILIYEFSWVAIVQPDRSFEVSRMD